MAGNDNEGMIRKLHQDVAVQRYPPGTRKTLSKEASAVRTKNIIDSFAFER
jgi:hypothetical protein